jgi:hypothetical protein
MVPLILSRNLITFTFVPRNIILIVLMFVFHRKILVKLHFNK